MDTTKLDIPVTWRWIVTALLIGFLGAQLQIGILRGYVTIWQAATVSIVFTVVVLLIRQLRKR